MTLEEISIYLRCMNKKNLELLKKYNKIKNPEQRDFFYDKYLLTPSITHFKNKGIALKQKLDIQFLISNIGYSSEPAIFFISLFKPKKSFFICSSETEEKINRIVDIIGLKSSEYEKIIIESTDVIEIYNKIKKVLRTIRKISRKKDIRDSIFVDLTAGKKAMTAGVAQAAGLLNLNTGYVNYERYNTKFRKPEPLSEYPVLLENPIKYFGEIEYNRAVQYFNSYQFIQAKNIFRMLKRRSFDSKKYWPLEKICELYNNWFNFNLDSLDEKWENFLNSKIIKFLPDNIMTILSNHLNIIKIIRRHDIFKIFNFYFAAERYAEIKRFDIAIFLFYRTIEKLFSFLLITEYGFDVSRPDWEKIKITKRIFNAEAKLIYKKNFYETDLPKTVAFMNAYTILKIKDNDFTKLTPINANRLLSFTQLRNKSIYTHGDIPLSKSDYDRARSVGNIIFEYLLDVYRDDILQIIGKSRNLKNSVVKNFKFLKLKPEII